MIESTGNIFPSEFKMNYCRKLEESAMVGGFK